MILLELHESTRIATGKLCIEPWNFKVCGECCPVNA